MVKGALEKIRLAIDEKDTAKLLHTNIAEYTEKMREDISDKDINITFCDCCGEADCIDSNDIFWVTNTECIDFEDERDKLGKLCDEVGCICKDCFDNRDVVEINNMAMKLFNDLKE